MGEVFKLNHCYNMDCLPAMELFPDNYFDLAVVDPPYFSGPERRGFYGSKVSKIGVHRDYPVSPAWSKPEPEYFRELLRVCRRYIVWGCNYFDYQFATGRIVWDKCNGNSSFSDCEIAATDLFSSVRMFRYMWSGMMQGKSITEGGTMQGNKSLNEKRIHPTQKPVALYDWIFKNYAEPGQKVLDTHLGSGSSRIAAYLYKARKIKSLARSTHTRASLHKGKQKGTEEQCKHTFKITAARCAPCSGYNVECKHYEKNSAADTKHGSSRT